MRFEVCMSPCLSVGRSIDAPSAFVSKSAQTEANRRCPVEDLQLIVHSSKGPAGRQSCSDSAEVWRQLHTGGVVWRHPTAWCEGHGDLAHRCYHAWRGEELQEVDCCCVMRVNLKAGSCPFHICSANITVLSDNVRLPYLQGMKAEKTEFTVQPHDDNLSRDILQSVFIAL